MSPLRISPITVGAERPNFLLDAPSLGGVSVEEVLGRVEEDLAAGYRPRARQRLKSLVAVHPQRLDLRAQLAELYRLDGDFAQAGRWGYLADDRKPHEVAAFEKAYGEDPMRMMRAVGWRGSEDAAGSEVAQQRLRALRARAEAEFGVPIEWELPLHAPTPPPRLADRVVETGCGVVAFAFIVLVILGIVSLAIEGFEVLHRSLG